MSALHALGGQWFHVTDAPLKPGDQLKPYSELHGGPDPERSWHQGDNAWRADRVWMSRVRRHELETDGKHTYVVQPGEDVAIHARRDPRLDRTDFPQFHASSATVVEKLKPRRKR